MQVLMVGGTGFIGYHAVRELTQRGHRVSVLALPPAPPADFFPSGVALHLVNVSQLTDEALQALLKGQDAVIFAAGADDRVTPKAPAYPFFYEANVRAAVRFFSLARQAGARRGVLLGSYFAHFDRIWPELNLSGHHPYIRSRQEQEREALAAAGADLDLMILELPYIFGATPGRLPLWAPLVDYVRSPLPLFYTRGGTNMVTVQAVAEAMAGALERGQAGQRYLVGGDNLTWADWLGRLARLAGRRKRVLTLPDGLVRAGAWFTRLAHRRQGRESGLDPVAFVRLQTRNTFFDPGPAQQALGYRLDGLDQALADTVAACPPRK